jgi:glycosyltransferase involved in cell wall biosynthesis
MLVLHDLRVGGAERVMLRLAGAFARRGAEVQVVALGGGGPLLAELPAAVDFLPLGAPRAAAAALRLVRHLRRARPDVVVATLPHVNVVAATAVWLARSPARLVLREANDPTAEHPFDGAAGALRGWATRRAYGRADAVVALTEGNAVGVRRHLRVAPERVRVIPNPAPSVPVAAVGPPPTALPVGGPRLLCVARLAPQKDHATLLDAFARLLAHRPDAVLALVGDGAERGALAARAASLGVADRVHFAGTVVDTEPWWRWADLLVLSSRWEGFPNVLLEALRHGVAIVATDCPTGPREVLDGGRYGILAPVGDPDALAAAIERALSAPAAPDALRERAAAYDLDGIAERWWALLEGAA